MMKDKKPALKRFPPGDRWVPFDADLNNVNSDEEFVESTPIFNSLTDGLEWIYKNYDSRKFIVDAEEQVVYIIGEEDTKPKKDKYSIYGE